MSHILLQTERVLPQSALDHLLHMLLAQCSWMNKMLHIMTCIHPDVKTQHLSPVPVPVTVLAIIFKQVSNQVCVPCRLQIIVKSIQFIYQEREIFHYLLT